jgi:hypothetical protein
MLAVRLLTRAFVLRDFRRACSQQQRQNDEIKQQAIPNTNQRVAVFSGMPTSLDRYNTGPSSAARPFR